MLDGSLAMQTGKNGGRVLQLIDLHGDVMTTLQIRDEDDTADWASVRVQAADEFGNPTDMTTGTALVTDGSAPDKDDRYGWLGGAQRSADALAGVILMGARLYDPATGRFWSRDPSPGGNTTAYDYCSGDPVNCTDLDGHWGFFKNLVKKVAKKVAKVAEVVATVVPGPVGAAAAAISAGAYAVSGNKKMAVVMAVGIVASAVGAGAVIAAVKYGGTALKIGRAAIKSSKVRPVRGVAHWNPTKKMGSADNAIDHFVRHGRGVRAPSVGHYLVKANRFLNSKAPAFRRVRAGDGAYVRWNPITNRVAISKGERQYQYFLQGELTARGVATIQQVLETVCRVCGFDEADHRYTDQGIPEYVICHCCGAESGVDDSTIAEVRRYRQSWIEAGCPWFVPELRPAGWSFETQYDAVPDRWK